MQARVQKWGNSLAIRIPKSFAAQSNLQPDGLVEMQLKDNAIVLRSLPADKPKLEDLLAGVTRQNRHGEVSTGRKQGREAW